MNIFHRQSCMAAFDNTNQFRASVACINTYRMQTYVTNINAQMDKFSELKDLGLVTLNQSIGSSKVPKEAATAVRYCSTAPSSLHSRI